MNKILNLCLVLTPVFLMLGCNQMSFTSKLNVHSQFTIQGKKDKDLVLNPGETSAKFIVVDKDTLQIKLKGATEGNVKFDIPKHVRLPLENGRVVIAGEEMNQDFDLDATLRTEHSTSSPMTTQEMCTTVVGYRQECVNVPARTECRMVNGKEVCRTIPAHTECRNIPIMGNGWQEVRYHYEDSLAHIAVTFKVPHSEQVLAELTGVSGESTRITDYQGPCIPSVSPYPHY